MNKSKRILYIATFTLAGETVFGFLSLLIGIAMVELYVRGIFNHPFQTCLGVISTIAFILMVIGGFLGFRGGVYFWPILYNDDGSLRFHNWVGFKARLRGANKKEEGSR